MAWFKEVLTWVLAFYYALYGHIAGAIRALVAVFKAPQAEPILPIAVTRNSFNKDFNPVEGGIPIPWVQFNPAMRRYSQKARRATPQYGTYPPSSPASDHDASALTVVLDDSSPSQINAPSPDGSLESLPLATDNAVVVYSSDVTSPAASTELPPSAPASTTEMEQTGDLSKGGVTNDVKDANNMGLAMVRYQPVPGAPSGRRRGIDIPAFASSSSSENKVIVAKRVSNVPVLGAATKHQNIQREPTLDISAFISPQLEFESVFKTFIPDVDSDGNRLSAILDQSLEFLDGASLPDSAMVLGMNARFRRKAYRPIIKALVQTAGEDSLDDLLLEPREVQKSPSLTLMEKCIAISIPVRSSPIIQEETLSDSNQYQVDGSESFLPDLPLDSFSTGRTGMQPLSGTCSSDCVSVGNPPVVSKGSSALAMASILARLASDWDDDDPAFDPRLRFEEDSDTGDEGDDEISSTSNSGNDWTVPDYLPARNFDNISSPLEDSPASWVDSPVSESTSPTSEDDGSDDLEVPSPIVLRSIRKHSDRRLGIYGSLAVSRLHENPSPELLADSPVSDSTSPTSVGSESDEFEPLSANVLERSRKDLNRRLGFFGDTLKQVPSPSEVPFPVSVDDAVGCDGLASRRPLLLSTHSLRTKRKRVSGLQPLQLPRIVSMRHLGVGDPLPPKNFQRVSQWVHEPSGSAGA